MKFTQGELTTPAKRVLDIIEDRDGVSPYEIYRQTQLVASTRDAEWYCLELGRVGLIKHSQAGRSCWFGRSDLSDRQKHELLKQIRPPNHKHDEIDVALDDDTVALANDSEAITDDSQ